MMLIAHQDLLAIVAANALQWYVLIGLQRILKIQQAFAAITTNAMTTPNAFQLEEFIARIKVISVLKENG
jgi:hypothetical protein